MKIYIQTNKATTKIFGLHTQPRKTTRYTNILKLVWGGGGRKKSHSTSPSFYPLPPPPPPPMKTKGGKLDSGEKVKITKDENQKIVLLSLIIGYNL